MTPGGDPLVGLFAPLGRLAVQNHELARNGPAAGSQAAQDGATALGRMAWDLASPAMSVGIDHLFSWKELRVPSPNRSPDPRQPVPGVQPAYAHLTLLRAAIEGFGNVRWLCDTAITSDERIRRAAGIQLRDFELRDEWERGLGPDALKPAPGGRTARQRIAGVERLLRMCRVIPERAPSATRLFGLYAYPDADLAAEDADAEGRSLFRLISSAAHAKNWALLPLTQMTDLLSQPGGRQAARVEPSDDLAAGVTGVAMRVAAAALDDMERYAGRPMRKLP